MTVLIRDVAPADAPAIAAIYNHFIRETIVTFEEMEIDAAEMARRMDAVRSVGLPWLVAAESERVVGYAYATKWKERIGYRFSVESTIYLHPNAVGKGTGLRLYQALFALLPARGVHAIMGGIALPNDASVALHERMGMTRVAHFRETGFKFGRWIDVVYYELVLPTQSATA